MQTLPVVVCFAHCISLEKGLPSLIYLGAPWMLRQHFYDAVYLYFLAVFGNKFWALKLLLLGRTIRSYLFENTPALAMLVTEGRALKPATPGQT